MSRLIQHISIINVNLNNILLDQCWLWKNDINICIIKSIDCDLMTKNPGLFLYRNFSIFLHKSWIIIHIFMELFWTVLIIFILYTVFFNTLHMFSKHGWNQSLSFPKWQLYFQIEPLWKWFQWYTDILCMIIQLSLKYKLLKERN